MSRFADSIEPTAPSWLWEDRIPRGALTLLVGAGGVGKSTLAAELAARLTCVDLTGAPEVAHLALMEDDAAAVTIPRLMVAGADLSRCILPDDARPWRFPRDIDLLRAHVFEHRPGLVVLDPLDAMVPNLAGQPARAVLDDLAEVAHASGTAFLLVHHLTKSGRTISQRIGGGRAVSAVARSILVLDEVCRLGRILLGLEGDSEPPDLVLKQHKSSYGPLAGPLTFSRQSEPHPVSGAGTVARLVEGEPLPEALDDLVTEDERPRGWRRRIARALIERLLLRGAMTAEDLASDIEVAEISQETFERAPADLAREGVIESFQSKGRHWWRLSIPDAPPQ
jgi:hypothetical protein